MLLPCSRARAVFAPEGIQLYNPGPAGLLWDEHGGTFVLKVSDLKISEDAAGAVESGIRLELALNDPQALLKEITGFARQLSLSLTPPSPPGAEWAETPVLAAFHVPERNLFIYCEDPSLRVRASGPQTLELAVTGEFTRPPGALPGSGRRDPPEHRGQHPPAQLLRRLAANA